VVYLSRVPKLWDRTIEAHRREVSEAIFDTTWALVRQHGLRAVTMTQVAAEAGIGRATLYKYFSDVDAILLAWHQRYVAAHLAHLADLAGGSGSPRDRLEAVLEAYAVIAQRSGQHAPELLALLHHHQDIARAHHQLRTLIEDLLAEAAGTGELRRDVAPDELAGFCLRALAAAADLPGDAAVHRLVCLVLAALSPSAGEIIPK
jgi:AcrR family transcriptional regulator